ncbi:MULTISPECIES: DEAD/DEAH box helicase [unclassified Oleiphilus]|uniref:DEAD/DEAH box helicase n=2 Tax=Oleiphilus TaxID=141450 RepID=UPI0007C400BF|nr:MULTISPECIES: DEAD/DEAH box helicase [unclassified Oleiphilus]KZY45612.1 DEAD/DEAH box helicase [Oleiphilus sp. HI0050]KZY76343.1 DEAD/DEAH box helicase [Oleiphilus sp. HI0068]KZY84214.1 DEAD/DEAH box helicase [Oleiphilus sp. HI0069]KZZ06496.1 DEAD/DEAH box helicase [Oleiphilus sp. HI0078]KZZ46576.1 DEAD/DEAH box helicase [Oleiphilus sp. HI0085]
MSFQTLGLSPQLLTHLLELGYLDATPIQQAAIPEVLAGHDVMAGAQTGTGKTAAFALPIIQKLIDAQNTLKPINDNIEESSCQSPKALVLTPTRELALQVFNSINTYSHNTNIQSAIAYGGVSLNPQIQAIKKGVSIVVATPGRLLDLLMKECIDLNHIEFLVFDEADRMLDMGFINDINRILRGMPKQRQTLLFSATFDQAIFDLSKKLLKDPKLIEVDARNTAAKKVEQMVYTVDKDRKRELTSYLIGSKNWQQVLIFTRTKQAADELSKEMIKDGLKTAAIHGDKSQGARERALEDFKQNKLRALVATDVAARGLDIDQLKYVINYELPYVAEDYIHRIGRTGRAGQEGLAISLLSLGEEYLLEEIEAVLDERLPQQWLPGYEPDLTKEVKTSKKNSRTAQKKRRKDRAYGKKRK